MKSILTLIAIILLPISLFAMTLLSEEDLSAVTGQAGVSIMPNIMMDIHIDVLAWGDSDGLGLIWGSSTSGGYIGVTNLSINGLSITPRTDVYNGLWPITIDVSSGVVTSTDEAYARLDLAYLQNHLLLSKLKLR